MIVLNAVGYDKEELKEKAEAIAHRLNYQVDQNANPCLFLTEEKIALKLPNFSLLNADFSSALWKKRKNEGKKQGLVRACKPASGIKIIDATAGWGRDSAVLASFGAEVLMLERHPALALLLEDALERRNPLDTPQLQLTLKHADAQSYLKALKEEAYPDVIYVDPMHPERNKSALVKKDLQALQQIIGFNQDALALIHTAITRVKQRVVVKWPQKSAPLLPPAFSIEGKTVRFDVYVLNISPK